MSPHAGNIFTGHYDDNDPRTPLHGAGGCVWPTVPAVRYQLISDNATRAFAIWNFTPGLVTRMVNDLDHDLYYFAQVETPPGWQIVYCRKRYDPTTEGYTWELRITIGSLCTPMDWFVKFPGQRCNVDVNLGTNHCVEFPQLGEFGSTFRMRQVKFDETVPPPPPPPP